MDDIPEFPGARQIALGDGEQIRETLTRNRVEAAEMTFGSLFIWRAYEGRSMLSLFDGHLIVSWFRQKYGKVILSPLGSEPSGVLERFSKMSPEERSGFNGAFALTEPVVSRLKARSLAPISLRDEWDYVYRTKDLIELEGPKYHTQRKELKKATDSYQFDYERMTSSHLKQCLELEEKWCDLKHCTLDGLSAAEDLALKDALENFETLGFMGAVVLIDGRVQALTIGERLNSDTAVVHFEKANPEIRGLYQVINQNFCKDSLKDFEFVNREQDVGEPGLRRAKEGYHPHHFVEKHFLPFQ